MKISDLTPNAQNPRTITDQKKAMLKKALLKFGDLSGIVYNRKTKQLVGGHQRREAFDSDSVITVTKKYSRPTKTGTVAEGFVELKGERFSYREVVWDEITEKAANIAANKGAGEWDLPKLGEWLKELNSFDIDFDLELTMFDADELGEFAGIEVEGYTRTSATGVDEDEIPEKAPARSKLGDLYLLGSHRLVCGDSTDTRALDKLFDGKKADLTFTSPPYNANTHMSNTANDGPLYANYSDDMDSEDYVAFTRKILGEAIARTNMFVFWNVNYNANSRFEYMEQIYPYVKKLEETIVWKKNALPVPSGLTRVYEFIFAFKCADKKVRLGRRNETFFNFWDISNLSSLTKEHRAAFPVALPLQSFELVEGAHSVFDPFGGTGTTMIAAEKTSRSCFMMELDPEYCDVIVARWEKYTGLKAKLVRTETKKKLRVKQAEKQAYA